MCRWVIRSGLKSLTNDPSRRRLPIIMTGCPD